MKFIEVNKDFDSRINKRIGDFVMSKDFTDYSKALKRAKKLQDAILKIEQKIYGDVESVSIYTELYDDWHKIDTKGRVFINLSTKNLKVRFYGQDFHLRWHLVEDNFSLRPLCICDTILITLRRLYKEKVSEIEKSKKVYEAEANKKYKKEHPEEYKKGFRSSIGMSCNSFDALYKKKYRLEDFFTLFISNIDVVTAFLELSIFSDTLSIEELEKQFSKYYDILVSSSRIAMPSKSLCCKEIKYNLCREYIVPLSSF